MPLSSTPISHRDATQPSNEPQSSQWLKCKALSSSLTKAIISFRQDT
ncbi:hypothetical protein PJE062_618 [Pseudovibrio sp. JE062]|nr:hypothetical protein PJE062_618 [Pseudovibrio sp. JE062]